MKWALGVALLGFVVMGWAAMATIPTATASIDDAALRFLPPDTAGVIVIDVAGLRDAPLVQDLLKEVKSNFFLKLQVFTEATGLDPQRDIDKITVAKVGARVGFAVVQARFDKFKVEQFMKDQGQESRSYLGQTIYGDGDGAVALLDNVIVVGEYEYVKKAMDQMQLPGSLPLRADLLDAMKTIDGGNQIWGVGDLSTKDFGTAGIQAPAPVIEMLKSLESGTYQMRVDSGVSARATAKFGDPEAARSLSDLTRGALAAVKMQVANRQPDMLQVLDGIQISSSGTTLTVKVDESGEQLQKLKALGQRAALIR